MNTGPVLVDVAVKDAKDAVLDWLVAQVAPQCQGLKWEWQGGYYMAGKDPETGLICAFICGAGFIITSRLARDLEAPRYYPSTDWAQGGLLRDMFRVEVLECGDVVHAKLAGLANSAGCGATALIAICRAIVASKLGDIVKVPHCLVMP